MVGIDPSIISHKLNVDPTIKPIKQKRRKFAPERNKVINDEVDNLLKTGKIREVKYPEWLANVVVVQKKNGKWRVCIDFTDLNKACPKDPFPLPHIDAMVDATAGHDLLTFMDAYSGYNQILMHTDDQEKTAFMTDKGIYCYKVMPFGLKNAGSTYQRLVNMIFKEHLGRTMEVYIDDMLVKSERSIDHVAHLKQSFDILRQHKMKLNPTKCSFGVRAGKFLGYLVTQRGIEASPEQVKAITEIQSPRNVKCDIRQILTLSIMSHESDPSEYRSHGSPEHPGSENGNSRSRTAVPERDPYSDDDADSRPVPAVRTGLRIRTTARKSVPLPTRMTFRIPTGDGAGPSRDPRRLIDRRRRSFEYLHPPPVARPSPVPRPPHMARAPVLCLKGMTPTERQEVARLARGQDIHEHLLDHHDHMIDSLLGVAGADSQQLTRIVALLSHTMASLHHLYTVVYLVVTVVVLLLLWTVWRVRA
ncbi:hypothetical protein OSB04_028927 [Centaurea solstitialis]|uniref:Reverse transcriptase domain-containing protein n=1 Tax=Centaurea solstitialis TaxID=347529 RepID=A0AA38WBP1_9ASTR|nr:hypothetical protein OSB04_028927 [Centaurea solstitialis]